MQSLMPPVFLTFQEHVHLPPDGAEGNHSTFLTTLKVHFLCLSRKVLTLINAVSALFQKSKTSLPEAQKQSQLKDIYLWASSFLCTFVQSIIN